MSEGLLGAMAVIPAWGVPIAALLWVWRQITICKAPLRAVGGFIAVGVAWFAAGLLFFINIYCESCSGRPPSAHDIYATTAYFSFGLVVFVVLYLARGKEAPKWP